MKDAFVRPRVRRLSGMVRVHQGELRLTLISFLSLYFELTLIRWIPTQVRLLAYFTNFVLIAALLGLGVGLLLALRRTQLAVYFPLGLLVLVLLVELMRRAQMALPIVSEGEFVWAYIHQLPATGVLSYSVLILFFVAMVAVFALIGQEVGRALRLLSPLTAYSLNILGSLLGVLGFALVNHLEVSPPTWFGIGSAGFAFYLFLVERPSLRVVTALLPLLVLLVAVYVDADQPPGSTVYWSPYYKISVAPSRLGGELVGFDVVVNQDTHQHARDLSTRYIRFPVIASYRHMYTLPYRLVHPRRILIFGAGTGNDVSAAIRNAPRAAIDAVEIDPVIARLGRQLHPEHPYANPMVRLHVDDARSFIQRTTQHYDLIVFGFLDSHRLFSHMSSVRLDNYVYTQENFETVRRHLRPGGIVAVGFGVHEKWIADRNFTLLARVFGHAPLVYQGDHNVFGTMFLDGRQSLKFPAGEPVINNAQYRSKILAHGPRSTWNYTSIQGFLLPGALSDRASIVSDDWPYLYMRERSIPPNYLLVLLLTVIVSLAIVWLILPRISFREAANWNFFLLGAAFALQETKGITDIAILFGSTWITNIIVISSILLVILIANLAVRSWGNVPLLWFYAALIAALVVDYVVPSHNLLEYGFWIQVAAAGLRVAGPLFFSGIIFARWFQRTENTAAALGANLMGAVAGGLSEYSSLVLGLRDLYLLALLFYALSFALVSTAPALRHFQQRRSVAGINA